MANKNPIEIPDFVIQNLNEGKPLSGEDMGAIEGILGAAESYSYPDADTDAQWVKFRSRIESQPLQVTKKPVIKRQFAMFRWVAAAVVVFVLGIGIRQYYVSNDPGFTATYKSGNSSQTINLPDGSELVLNKLTELEVKKMNGRERVVELKSGQAFFNIRHNDLPFLVETPKGNIMVLGTEFDVKAYKNERFSVFLKKGKIEMKLNDEVVEMKPGQLLNENENNEYVLSSISDNRAYSWLDNKLIFENTSLAEVISVLESNYKVKFNYDENLKDEKVNLKIESLSADQVADLLSKTLNSKVSVE